MPGLIMSNIPSELSRRSATHFTESTNLHSYTSSSPRESLNAPTMTVSTAAQAASSATAPSHGGASSAMMSASSNGRALRPVERLRLRDWLVRMIEAKAIPGLYWLDKEKQIVKIPWKHAARHGWSRDKDACLFRAWAIHTKKYDQVTDSPKANPKIWKANFRCAINSLPDIEELREKGKSKGNDAYKVYRLHPKKSKRHTREAGVKVPKRQRSTSKPRSNRYDKKQRRRDVVISSSENVSKASSHFTIPTSFNSSSSNDDLRTKKIGYSMADSTKRDCMSLNVHCVFKPDGVPPTSAPPSLSSSAISSSSSITSPTTPYSVLSPSTGLPFIASSTMPRCNRASPCSTANSTPATTPQSPPPPYPVAVSQRHGAGWINIDMEARVNFNHSQQGFDSYCEELSDSDCSIMTEAEVAQMVLDIKEQSPGNSPRCMSPLDGNNNMGPTMNPADFIHNKIFFGQNYEMMAQVNRPVVTKASLSAAFNSALEPQIKMEPDAYPMAHHGVHGNGYADAALYGTSHHHVQDAFDTQSSYLLQQL